MSSAPIGAPSARNFTPATPTLSEAVALTVTVALTNAPPNGAVMATVGGVLSLKTVTVTGSDVYSMPTMSRATAVKVCEAFVAVFVSHGTEYGAVVSCAPRLTPSSLN